jgi:hypothetical protein
MTPYNTYLDAIKSALQPDARLPPPYPKFQSSGWVVGFGRRRRVPASAVDDALTAEMMRH